MKPRNKLLAAIVAATAFSLPSHADMSTMQQYDRIAEQIELEKSRKVLLELQSSNKEIENGDSSELDALKAEHEDKIRELTDYYVAKIKEIQDGRDDTIEQLKQQIKDMEADHAEAIEAAYEAIDEAESQEIEAKMHPRDQAHVIGVKGYGSDLRAQIFYQNVVMEKRAGDYLAPGIKVHAVATNGALISIDGVKKEIHLVDADTAYFESYKGLMPYMSAEQSDFSQEEEVFDDFVEPTPVDFNLPEVNDFSDTEFTPEESFEPEV